MSITKKIYFTLLVGLFIGLLVKEFIMDKQLQQVQYERAKVEAQGLKNSIVAFRNYMVEVNEKNDEGNLLQKAHPLNTAIESNFLTISKNNIQIKTASDKPILPENLANKHETEDIKYFDKNKNLSERFTIYKENDIEYYHYSYALRLDQKCLSCHSNYSIGDTRGIISIYIPKIDFDNDRIMLSNNSYTVTFIVLLVIFIVLYITVIKPLANNMKKFQNNLSQFFDYINDVDDEIDFQEIKSSDELGIMSKKIHKNIKKAKKVLEDQKKSHKELQNIIKEKENKKDISKEEEIKNKRSKSVTLLINNISTNLHTPLKELKNQLQELDKSKEEVDTIVKRIDSIENVLTQYKFFFEQEDIKREFKLQDIIKKCNMENHFEYKKENIEIIDDYENIQLTSYEKELYQVILNILGTNINNLKTSSHNEKVILISTNKNEKNISIHIKDNGGGFEPQNLEKLFNPQINNDENINIDSLKLYIAKEIIEYHLNGKLELVNIDIDYKGKTFRGSEFIVLISL